MIIAETNGLQPAKWDRPACTGFTQQHRSIRTHSVIPAKAGIQTVLLYVLDWTPAFAGVTPIRIARRGPLLERKPERLRSRRHSFASGRRRDCDKPVPAVSRETGHMTQRS